MRFLHTMLRVRDLDVAMNFFCTVFGLEEVMRSDNEKARYTVVFLAAPADVPAIRAATGRPAPSIELTYNWDSEEDYGEARFFGHIAYEVDDIYATCARLAAQGIPIVRPPRDGRIAFIRSPDLHSIELLQRGQPLAPQEPWASMPNAGRW